MSPDQASAAPNLRPADDRLAEFRRRTLDLLLLFTLAAASIPMALLTPASIREQRFGFLAIGWGGVLWMAALAALRQLPYRARVYPFLALQLTLFALELPRGVTAVSATNAAVPVIFAAILLGARAGIAWTLVVMALLATATGLSPEALQVLAVGPPKPVIPPPMATLVGLLPLLGGVAGIGIVVRGMARSFDEAHWLVKTLEASEKRFRGIFEASPEAIAVISKTTGRFIDVNRQFEKLFGWPAADILGRSVQEIGAVAEGDVQLLQAHLESDAVVDGIEQHARRRDGSILTVEVSLRSAHIDGQPVMLIITRDVTAHRRLEAAVRIAQRVETMGTIAGGVAHNFRNALGAILPNLDYCLGLAPAELHEPLRDARSAASSAVDLASRLTRMANPDRTRLGPVELRAVLADVVGICRSTFGARLTLVEELEADGMVLAERGELHQIFLNLCLNARDAVADVAAPRIHVSLRRSEDGGWLVASVADNGYGMDPETLNRIGEPFFTTKGGQGTGLGLSTAYAAIRAAGGRISVASRRAEGTTFTVALPIHGAAVAIAEAPAPPRLGQGVRALVVDDDPLLLEAVCRQLGALGLTAEPFRDAAAALARVRAGPESFQVLITDLDMPGVSGRELAVEARRAAPQLPVLVLSGSPRSDEIIELSTVLTKPASTAELAAALADCLGMPVPEAPRAQSPK